MIKTTHEAPEPSRTRAVGGHSRNWQGANGGGLDSEPVSPRNPIRMLRLSQVVEKTGLGKTSIYELQKEGRFPRSVHVTGHSVRWIEAEVETWLVQQAQARIPVPKT
jgi:prophage regulatory protein